MMPAGARAQARACRPGAPATGGARGGRARRRAAPGGTDRGRGSTVASSAAQQTVRPGPGIGLFDVAAGVIDQMHVVHAGRTRRHAGEAGQAAVDVGDHALRRRPGVLEHVLDQVDAAARAVELVTEQHVGRAGRGAEAAVHARAQDLLQLPHVGIGQLGEREGGLHGAAFRVLRGKASTPAASPAMPGCRCPRDRGQEGGPLFAARAGALTNRGSR